jgi:hypothetical protein
MSDPIQTSVMTPKRTARYMRNIYKGGDDNDCWIWIDNHTRDYDPYFIIGRAKCSARTIAHILFVGPVSINCTVVNTCNNPLCVNPEHLTMV